MRRCLAHVHTLATASLGQHTAPLPLLAQVQSVASTSCSPSSTINSPSCSSHSSSSSSSSSAGPQRHFSCGEAGPSSTHSFSLHSLAPSLPHHHHHQQRSHSSSFASSSSRRAFSTPATGEEQDVDKIGNEKVQRLAAEVLGLTVLESSQLSTILRKKLDIPKPTAFGGAMPAFPAAGMPGMGGPAGPQPAGQQAEGAAAPEPPKAKTEFDVKLDSFTADGKIKVIKEIRALTNLGLKEAKELVEKAPIVLKSGVPKEDAENWKKVIETAGGKVELA